MATIPKLALIPSGYKAGKIYSVLPTSGVGDFDFTRASSATRINSSGLIETVASNVPRLNYPLIDGVVSGCPSYLLEDEKQNVLQRSEEFDNAYWVDGGITINANQSISPSGELNADLLTGVSTNFAVLRFATWSATNKVASCFAKKGSSDLFKINNASGSNRYVIFNLSNGTVSEQSTDFEGEIENYGNGWYRCTAIDTLARSGTFSLGVTAASESIYIWGAQLESDYKTSYIPTTTAPVTRSRETAIGSGDASNFGSEGVLFAEISAFANDGTIRAIAITDGTINNIIVIRYWATPAGEAILQGIYVDSVGGSSSTSITFPNLTDFAKVALSYGQGALKLYVNGTLEQSVALVVNDTINWNTLQFNIGNGSQVFYGNVKQVQSFDSALNDSDLETLTSWTSFTDLANGQLYSIK